MVRISFGEFGGTNCCRREEGITVSGKDGKWELLRGRLVGRRVQDYESGTVKE
jgi:hypothetical protein